jgi:EAL domain-containing protein (putative c-di-GMP-specific phosphodiesterase class I)
MNRARRRLADVRQTAEQSQLLRLLGCDEMQGYLISKGDRE